MCKDRRKPSRLVFRLNIIEIILNTLMIVIFVIHYLFSNIIIRIIIIQELKLEKRYRGASTKKIFGGFVFIIIIIIMVSPWRNRIAKWLTRSLHHIIIVMIRLSLFNVWIVSVSFEFWSTLTDSSLVIKWMLKLNAWNICIPISIKWIKIYITYILHFIHHERSHHTHY